MVMNKDQIEDICEAVVEVIDITTNGTPVEKVVDMSIPFALAGCGVLAEVLSNSLNSEEK
jgi:hypothetical protein